MATKLRDILARFRIVVDRSQLEAAKPAIARAKASLQQLSAQGAKVIKPRIDGSALNAVSTGATRAGAALGGVRAQANRLGTAMSGLRQRAAAGLDGIRARAVGAVAALRSVAVAVRGVGAASTKAAASVGIMGKAISVAKNVAIGFVAVIGFNIFNDFIDGTLAAADALGKTSAAFGVSTDDLQVWTAFAQLSGGSINDLQSTLRKLSQNMSEFADGKINDATQAMKDFGFEAVGEDGKLKNLGDSLLEIGGQLADMEDATLRAALAQKVLGKGALAILPGFANGSKALEDQIAVLKEVAIVYSTDFIKQAEAANDEMLILSLQMQRVKVAIVNFIIPAFRRVSTALTPVIKAFSEWLANGAALEAALGVGVFAAVSKLISLFGSFGAVLRRIAVFVLRFLLPFLILEDIIVFLRGGDSALGRLLDSLFGLGTAEGVLEILSDAFKGVQGAIEFMWGSITGNDDLIEAGKANLEEFTTFGKQVIDDFALFFKLVLPAGVNDALASAGDAFSSWGTGIGIAGEGIAEAFAGNWDEAGSRFSDALDFMINGFASWGGITVGIVADVLEFFGIRWQAVPEFMQNVLDTIVGTVSGAFDTIAALVDSVVGVFRSGWQGVANWFTGLWAGVAAAISAIWDGVIGAITSSISAATKEISDFVKDIPIVGGRLSGLITGGGSPTTQTTNNSGGNITINDNSTVNTNVAGGSAGTAAAVRSGTAATQVALGRKRGATVRQLGASL